MNRTEFMRSLRNSLTGRVSAAKINDIERYYEDYFNIEIRKGKTEQQVLDDLGDPRLIARTIVQTEGSDSGAGGVAESDFYGQEGGSGGENRTMRYSLFNIPMPGWLFWLILAAIAILILAIVFSVVAFLAPFVLAGMLILFVVNLVKKWFS